MGCRFELAVAGPPGSATDALLEAGIREIRRIEALLTEFSDTSVTAEINRHAGMRPVTVPAEVYDLLGRCAALSRMTQGAFDITVGPLKKLYDFRNGEFTPPPAHRVRAALARTGYRHLRLLGGRRVFLEKPGMRISFAAVGKGYAADRARAVMRKLGAAAGSVNASGDLSVWGPVPQEVGIAHPDRPGTTACRLPLQDAAVATSGDYEQHFRHGGRRYSHNLHPLTGLPLTGLKSVSVVCGSAELADGLSTAVYVMGPGTGLHLVNQLAGVHAIVIDDENRIYHSENIRQATA